MWTRAYSPLRLCVATTCRSSPQLGRSSPRLATARRCRLFDRALQSACAMWSADTGCVCCLLCWPRVVCVGLLLLVAPKIGLVFVYLSAISVFISVRSQFDLSFRRCYFRAPRSYLTSNSQLTHSHLITTPLLSRAASSHGSPLRCLGPVSTVKPCSKQQEKAPDVDFFARLPVGLNSDKAAGSSVSLI